MALVFHVISQDHLIIYPIHMKSPQSFASFKSTIIKIETEGLSMSSIPDVIFQVDFV